MNRKLKNSFISRRVLITGVSSALLIFVIYISFNFDDIYFNHNPKKATFSKLEKIRKEKKGESNTLFRPAESKRVANMSE